MIRLSGASIYLLCGLSALAAVGLALLSQHQFRMLPCPWCVLQRLIFLLIGCLGVLAWLSRPRFVWRSCGLLMVVLSLGGISAALYQHFVAAKSSSCKMTLADTIISGMKLDTWLPSVFEVRASCADAAVKLVGIPYEFWSATLFALLGLAAFKAWRMAA